MAGPFTRLQPPPNASKYKGDTNLYVADLGQWFTSVHKILGTVDGGVGWMILNQAEATEGVQDIVGAFVRVGTTDGTNIAVLWTYDDGAGTLKAHVLKEDVQDTIAAFISAGNALTATYDDVGNVLTLDVDKAAASADAATTITGTADLAYDATERDMLNAAKTDIEALKTSLNDLKAKMRTAGLLTV